MVMVKRTYLHLSIVTLVTAMVWLLVTIYQSLTEPAKITIDPAIKTPLSAKLDQEILDNILAREDLSALAFEPPSATASAITINEIVPTESEPVIVEESSAPEPSEEPTNPDESLTPVEPDTSE